MSRVTILSMRNRISWCEIQTELFRSGLFETTMVPLIKLLIYSEFSSTFEQKNLWRFCHVEYPLTSVKLSYKNLTTCGDWHTIVNVRQIRVFSILRVKLKYYLELILFFVIFCSLNQTQFSIEILAIQA